MSTTLEHATSYHRGGLSVIPIEANGSKASTIKWGPYQREQVDAATLPLWFGGQVGIAVCCGSASGGAEVIDLDSADIAGEYRELVEAVAPGLLAKVTIVETPRPGFHLWYRCSEVGGNQKLAMDADGNTLIETRGQGGYALVPGSAPSAHPTGKPYVHRSGPPLDRLAEITPEERRTLLDAARSLNRVIEHHDDHPLRNGSSRSPGADYNESARWEDILPAAGWSEVFSSGGRKHWCRPGKSTGTSATTGIKSARGADLLCVFSSNANPFPGPGDGRSCSTHSKFDAYARLHHNGDHSAAAKALASEGYGDRPQRQGMPDWRPDDLRDDDPGEYGDYQEPQEKREHHSPIEKFTFAELRQQYPQLRPVVIEGLAREGETINLNSVTKVGKSWLGYNLALTIITGGDWLDTFHAKSGKVLLVDNELHKETISSRVATVADAMGIPSEQFDMDLEVWPLRGRLRPLESLRRDIEAIEPGEFKAIIFDAKYRFAAPGSSENDNAQETQIYNLLDQYGEHTRAALVLIHHTTKGNQSDKRVTDVGSGAGAQSRAADCHAVIREHEQDGCFVLDAAVRSFAPIRPLGLRFNFPVWCPDPTIDPERLKRPKGGREDAQAAKDREGFDLLIEALRDNPLTATRLVPATKMGKDRIRRLLALGEDAGYWTRTETEIEGNRCVTYHLCTEL